MISTPSRTHASHAPLLRSLEREHFPATRFIEPQPGTFAAQFLASRLTSTFQPVVRAADGEVAGHHALLRIFDTASRAMAPWRLLAQASEDAMLVQLDRLTRAVHALNYFCREEGTAGMLYLNVECRLLSVAADHHGAYFELILDRLDVPTHRIAIMLPAAALEDPVSFVRAAIAYRIRGYRVVAQLRSARDADLEHLFLAEPHDVALDSPLDGGATRDLVHALKRRGIHAIARRIESAADAQAARDLGFDFLQGRHFDS